MTQEELNKIIENHQHWLRRDCVCWEDMRADLGRAYLVGANLRGSDLGGADLRGACLVGTDLKEADLGRAFNIPFIPMTCPDTGSFIGWKKAKGKAERVIVKLLIPEDAKRSSATGRKCRCDKAEVLSIESLDGKIHYEIASSNYDDEFIYKVGKTVSVPDFCEDRFNECAAGIQDRESKCDLPYRQEFR